MSELKNKIINQYQTLCKSMHARMLCNCNRQRKYAIDSFEENGFPNKKDEDWKYTPLDFIDEHDFEIAQKHDQINIPQEHLQKILDYSYKYNTVCLVNGFYHGDLSSISCKKGVVVHGLEWGLNKKPNLVGRSLPAETDYDKYPFTAINHAIAQDGVFIKIDPNKRLQKPICIINLTVAEDKPVFTTPRNIICVGSNSIASFITIDLHSGNEVGFSNMVTEIKLDEYSYLDLLHLQSADNPKLYNFSYTRVDAHKRACLNKNVISMDGKYIRNNDHVNIEDEGVEINLNGLFYADGDSFIDNHTFIKHDAVHTSTNENYKGIIDDKATGVFNGMILVQPDAQQTNAFQSNHNILLSDDATINSKPELEIYADDVKCSHGATSGSIDPEQIFYLKARGISEEIARSLLIAGFAGEIINKIKNSDLRDTLNKTINKKLNLDEL